MDISVGKVILPNKPLSNIELTDAAKELKLTGGTRSRSPNFRGVFMRDQLPKRPLKNECGILNLDDTVAGDGIGSSNAGGTHWTCWFKRGNKKIYFDSYGCPPPIEFIDYMGHVDYNTKQVQPNETVVCGHLCLYMLNELKRGKEVQKILAELI